MMLAKQRGLRELLVPPNLEDVILVQQEKDPQSSPEDYVNAINHYREYDSFLN